ncbi:hypothetical protein BGX38DRAFT_1234838 [Terfezia claveryi]|nr:hypothetical protein BGX38DRAFT_1234838 [Terfezia claveryi]
MGQNMPKIPWEETPQNWADAYPALFTRNAKQRTLINWTPKSQIDGRDPSDNVIVAIPHVNPQEDGRCYLRSTPTYFRPRVGFSKGKKVRVLLDNCANLCLANMDFLQKQIPELKVDRSFMTEVKGIGQSSTEGFVHIPIYIDCMSRVGGKTGKVELNLEVHVIKDLPVDMVIGMDAISAYGIDTIISRELATLTVNGQELAFPIEFKPSKTQHQISSREAFPVICNKTTKIPAMHEGPIEIVTGLKLEDDSNPWLDPMVMKNDNRAFAPLNGGWVAPGPMSRGQSKVLFANFSSRPMTIRRGQSRTALSRHQLHMSRAERRT